MKKLSFLLLALMLMPSLNLKAQVAPKRELRSVWLASYSRIDWPSTTGTSASARTKQQNELIKYLDNFDRRNFQGVCIQVRSIADAIYNSSLEPWSEVISGTRGVDPGWDPLAFAVEECHKRGLECWAWVNPFRQRRKSSNYTTSFDKDWAQRGLLLTYNTSSSYYTVFNPALPEARQHVLDVCREIYMNYAVDGMLFDDYFYPNNIPENSSVADYSQYKSSGTTLSIGDWRRENINSFMRELYAQIQNDRPDMRFGLSPAGIGYLGGSKYGISKPNVSSSDWQYDQIYSDPIAWLADGSIDFISPQIYWLTNHPTAPYGPLCEWWSEVANRFGRHFYSSQGSYRLGDGTTTNDATGWNDFGTQIDMNREYNLDNAPGTIFYSAKYFDGPSISGFGQYLVDNCYQTKALTPVVAWKDCPNYPAPQGLKHEGNKLAWEAVEPAREGAIVRYTVYAVPETISIVDATSEDGDGLRAEYLVDVVYGTSIELPEAQNVGCWYAVMVYDGYGNEHEAAIIGNGSSGAVKVTSAAWNLQGRTLHFGSDVAEARVYTPAGALVMQVSDATELTMPASGFYVVATNEGACHIMVR